MLIRSDSSADSTSSSHEVHLRDSGVGELLLLPESTGATTKIVKRAQSLPPVPIPQDTSEDAIQCDQVAHSESLPPVSLRNERECSNAFGRSSGAVAKIHNNKKATIRQHYYPEGGWGWVIAATTSVALSIGHGLQLSLAAILPVQLQPPTNPPTLSWPPPALHSRGTERQHFCDWKPRVLSVPPPGWLLPFIRVGQLRHHQQPFPFSSKRTKAFLLT